MQMVWKDISSSFLLKNPEYLKQFTAIPNDFVVKSKIKLFFFCPLHPGTQCTYINLLYLTKINNNTAFPCPWVSLQAFSRLSRTHIVFNKYEVYENLFTFIESSGRLLEEICICKSFLQQNDLQWRTTKYIHGKRCVEK